MRRSQLMPWKTAGRVTERYASGDEVVRETGWVFNNATGEHPHARRVRRHR
jgi:hypothetical protein